MSRLWRLWPLAAATAAAALAFGAYAELHPSAAGERRLSQAFALAHRHARPSAVETALDAAVTSGSATSRSQAANLLAALVIRHRGTQGLSRAIALYTTAVRLDPSDNASKYDLELLLTLQGKSGQHGHRSKPRHGRAAPTKNRNGGTGAPPTGTGY